jgi:LAS superfamily LD-carboxypeptidase LdcB
LTRQYKRETHIRTRRLRMPRGVYDRQESKIRHLTEINQRLEREMKGFRRVLENKEQDLRAARAGLRAAANEINSTEQFSVLRDNLRNLAEARKTMVDSDQMSTEVMETLDKEITAHIECLAHLRVTAFRSFERVAIVQKAKAPLPEHQPLAPMPPVAGLESAVR